MGFTRLHKYISRHLTKLLTNKIIKNEMSTDTIVEEHVLFNEEHNKGIITLNKPKKLNSLDYNMIWKINDSLTRWQEEEQLTMVIINGVGRAFCSGADVVQITKGGPNYSAKAKEFFRFEYKMIGKIGAYPIPYVAIIDGITMGGGAGLSIHGTVRIATEKTLFAMPETAIGLFPDVGMTRVLSQLPGNLGIYLGLTGDRLEAADVAKFGIATHFIRSTKLPHLLEELILLEQPEKTLAYFLKKHTEDIKKLQSKLTPEDLKIVETCFSAPTVEEILKNLEKHNTKFAKKLLGQLKLAAPSSLKYTLKALQLAKNKSLKETLIMENRIASNICAAKISADFYEGKQQFKLTDRPDINKNVTLLTHKW